MTMSMNIHTDSQLSLAQSRKAAVLGGVRYTRDVYPLKRRGCVTPTDGLRQNSSHSSVRGFGKRAAPPEPIVRNCGTAAS
jgi:hypothetical protein